MPSSCDSTRWLAGAALLFLGLRLPALRSPPTSRGENGESLPCDLRPPLHALSYTPRVYHLVVPRTLEQACSGLHYTSCSQGCPYRCFPLTARLTPDLFLKGEKYCQEGVATMAPLCAEFTVERRFPLPSEETREPTRDSLTKEGGFLEAWAQGYNVGSLIILILIVFCNYRSGILLHKLILLEVRRISTHNQPHLPSLCIDANESSSFLPYGTEPSSSSRIPTTAGTSPLLPPSSLSPTNCTTSCHGSRYAHFSHAGAPASSSSAFSSCSLSGSLKPGPTSSTSTTSAPPSMSACVPGKPCYAIRGGSLLRGDSSTQ